VNVIDLFAGPGGWDVAASKLGLEAKGIEWDSAACATARAAGHKRMRTDVRAVDPRSVGDVSLLIASPPCQGFSLAGGGLGRDALDVLHSAINRIAASEPIEPVRASIAEECRDDRAALVVEPMHWIMQTRPETIALEQVPPVQPLWNVMARKLAGMGYSVDTGILSAEQYDVPQTRRRAILVASRVAEVRLPAPVRRAFRAAGGPLPAPLTLADTGLVPEGSWQRGNQNGSKYDANGNRLRMRRDAHEPSQTITGKAFMWENQTGWKSGTLPPRFSGVMQGFPIDYPWRGGITEQHQQAGDAVPPPLAWHVLRAALALPVEHYPS
jgi:DNA (cytosine-5)-methyltransferase 1